MICTPSWVTTGYLRILGISIYCKWSRSQELQASGTKRRAFALASTNMAPYPWGSLYSTDSDSRAFCCWAEAVLPVLQGIKSLVWMLPTCTQPHLPTYLELEHAAVWVSEAPISLGSPLIVAWHPDTPRPKLRCIFGPWCCSACFHRAWAVAAPHYPNLQSWLCGISRLKLPLFQVSDLPCPWSPGPPEHPFFLGAVPILCPATQVRTKNVSQTLRPEMHLRSMDSSQGFKEQKLPMP